MIKDRKVKRASYYPGDDMGEIFRDMRAHRQELRAKYGVPCPECVEKLPRAHPSILLPQQRCKIHGYKDPRPRLKPEEV